MSRAIVESALEVHRVLGGPGLLECFYEGALAYEIGPRKVKIQRQVLLPVRFNGMVLGNPLRIDLFVDDLVIVECKVTTQYSKVFDSC